MIRFIKILFLYIIQSSIMEKERFSLIIPLETQLTIPLSPFFPPESQSEKNNQRPIVKNEQKQLYTFNKQGKNIRSKNVSNKSSITAEEFNQLKQKNYFTKQMFMNFKLKYRRNYKSLQQSYRFFILKNNYKFVVEHNSKNNSYSVDINKFSDISDPQFQNSYLMKLQFTWPVAVSTIHNQISINMDKYFLKGIDYRKIIKFGPIKDQGKCPSCFAFAAIGSIQLNWALKKKFNPPALSQQQILDCCVDDEGDSCGDCNSGNMLLALLYLAKSGIAQEGEYSYIQRVGQCKLNKMKTIKKYLVQQSPIQRINGVKNVIQNLITKGPISTVISPQNWRFYSSGVFDNCKKKLSELTISFHAVVIVGIDSQGTWIIRNSWGSDWGQKGYIRIAAGNTCSLTDYALYPIIL